MTRAAVALILAFAVVPAAFAQSQSTDERRSYATVGLLWSIEPEATCCGSPHQTGPFGGSAIGVAGSVGHQLERDWSIEGGARFRGPISQGEIEDLAEIVTFTTTHREFAVEGLLVYTPAPARRLRVEPFVGVTFVRGITEHQQIVARSFNPALPSHTLPDETIVDTWFGAVFGARGLFVVTPRTAVVPSVTCNWLWNRDTPPNGTIGLASVMFDLEIGVRIAF